MPVHFINPFLVSPGEPVPDAGAYWAAVLASSPVLAMRFDEGSGTSYSSDVPGTEAGFAVNGGGTGWGTGPLDQVSALTLAGVNSYARVNESATNTFDGSALAGACWAKFDADGHQTLFSRSNAADFAGSSFYTLANPSGTIALGRFNGGSHNGYNTPNSMSILDGEWHWLAWRYTTSSFEGWVDGVSLGSAATSLAPNTTGQPVTLGARINGAGLSNVLDGSIALASYWASGFHAVPSGADLLALYDAAYS